MIKLILWSIPAIISFFVLVGVFDKRQLKVKDIIIGLASFIIIIYCGIESRKEYYKLVLPTNTTIINNKK